MMATMSSIARGPCHEEIICRRCGVSAADSSSIIPPSSEISRQEDDCCIASSSRQLDDGNMMSIHQQYTSNGHDRDRIRKRKRPRRRASIAMVSFAAFMTNNCSAITPVQAFTTPYQLHTVSPIQKLTFTSINAVHKRLGNHDISTSRASAERANNSNKKFVKMRGGKKTNVFEQFTPDYMTSPYDVDLSGDDDASEEPSIIKLNNGSTIKKKIPQTQTQKSKPPNNRVNKSQIITSNKINLRLRTLLKDDTNEQDPLIPDSSPQAANQLALKGSYNKLSEEARRKANEAVKAGNNDDGEEGEGESVVGDNKVRRMVKKKGNKAKPAIEEGEDEIATSNAVTLASSARASSTTTTTTTSRRGRVRATVKETGSDSMGSYIKSLEQHELLYKEDEILLGRQVRILSVLEERRYELEEELLCPPTYQEWAKATNHTVPSLKQQIRRSQRATAALIAANLRLVITVARQAVKKSAISSQSANSIQFQDACQQGIIGLTRATEKFDPELGFRFSTYAIWWIQKEVSKNVNEQSRSVRIPPSAIQKINDIRIQERVLMNELGRKPNEAELADRVGMSVKKLRFYTASAERAQVGSLDRNIDSRKGKGSMSTGDGGSSGDTMDKFVKDTEHPSPSELVDQEMLKEDIRRLVRTLSPREEAVIRLRFGLDDGQEPMSLADISAKFGVDVAKIKKVEARALLKLRQRCDAAGYAKSLSFG